ncbi:MAG: response regulator [Xanthobacteraceae bacterium]
MKPQTRENEKIRVLLVEDEFLIAEWIAEWLAEQGFAVLVASNSADALRHLAFSQVDVLFTDINLPGGMDGTALARKARELLPQLAVIYASARVVALSAEDRVPGAVFLAKPYQPATVGRLIAGAMHAAREPVFA